MVENKRYCPHCFMFVEIDSNGYCKRGKARNMWHTTSIQNEIDVGLTKELTEFLKRL